MMKKYLSYEELINLAGKNYSNGGSGVYECWDRQDYEDYGLMTKEEALKMFALDAEIYAEYEAEAKAGYNTDEYEANDFDSWEELEKAGDDWWEKEIRTTTENDYSPACPWNAPGMRATDFYR